MNDRRAFKLAALYALRELITDARAEVAVVEDDYDYYLPAVSRILDEVLPRLLDERYAA